MEVGVWILGGFLILFVGLMVVIFFYTIFKLIFVEIFKLVDEFVYSLSNKQVLLYYNFFQKELSTEEKFFLNKTCNFYSSLPEKSQQVFEHRVAHFCKGKIFQGKEGLILDSEKKLQIASVAIRLTFGYRYFDYDHFTKIIVFPNAFYSPIAGNFHHGETSMGGWVVLSWQNFINGEENPNDNINLGMHEFAHALYINETLQQSNIPFKVWIEKWKMILIRLKPVIEKMEFFREYAFVNDMEFFAVAVEYFFENPELFKEKLPNVYEIMSKLLNQDPLQYKAA